MTDPVTRASSTPATASLTKATKSLEAVFLRQMIGSMRTASKGEEVFGSDAGNQFRDMADARLADTMAGRFGIAQMLEAQLKGSTK